MPSYAHRFFTAVAPLAILLVVIPFENSNSQEVKITANVLWRHGSPETACEIVAYSRQSQQLFVTVAKGVEIVDARTGNSKKVLPKQKGYHATSVAVSRGRLAVAWAADDKSRQGMIGCYHSTSLEEIATFEAGYNPDMIVFSPNGRYLLTADEGEPTDDYAVDPEGSVTIIDTLEGLQNSQAESVGFSAFNLQRDKLRQSGVRIFGPSKSHADKQATVAEDLEPEYIAFTPDSSRAWITLQENNAIAELDLHGKQITAIHPLGTKDFSALAGQNSPWHTTGLDACDTDGGVKVRNWPVVGLFQPDGIASFEDHDVQYLITANEGDPRDYTTYHEPCQVDKLTDRGLRLNSHSPARFLLAESPIGHLEVSTANSSSSEELKKLECFGARSFAVWEIDPSGTPKLAYDSGNDFERIAAREADKRFHQNEKLSSNPDERSSRRGPEPESVVIGQIGATRIAMVSLERTGGVMIYDLTLPTRPRFLQYLPPHFEDNLLDCAPEGLTFISAQESPTGLPMLIVCNEVSGTTTAYQLELSPALALR